MSQPGPADVRATVKWQIDVDPAKCVGSGSCVAMARHQFIFDDHRRSRPVRPAIDPDPAVLNAALSCPVEAIAIIEIDGGRTRRLAG